MTAVFTTEELQQRALSHYGDGALISKDRYSDRSFFERERTKLWQRVWQVACRESEVRAPGDYVEYNLAGESVLIIRDGSGTIRALSNVCRHRATFLKTGSGNARELRCPFHGWTYGLDGSLSEVTNDWDFPHIDKTAMCLPEFKVDTWGGFVFVTMDDDPEPLAEFLAPLPSLVDKFALEDHVRVHGVSTILPCNWKLNIEAFIESYHAPFTHPQTATYSDDVGTAYDLLGRHGRMVVRAGASPNIKVPVDDYDFIEDYSVGQMLPVERLRELVDSGRTGREAVVELRRAADWDGAAIWDITAMSDSELLDIWQYNVFPNFVFLPGPSGLGITTRFLPNGDDPETSIFEIQILRRLAPGEERPADAPILHYPAGTSVLEMLGDEDTVGLIFNQDVSNLLTIQQGVKSKYFPGVTLGLYQESRIRHLEEVLDSYLSRD